MSEEIIIANITKVLAQVSTAAQKHGRPADAVRVMAVSKTQPVEAVRTAARAGMRDFGENYLQEAVAKIEACADLSLRWHFIGPIQSNKTRPLATHFDWVHSVEREKILRRLSDHRDPDREPLNVCLQVNISGEASKSGARPEDIPALAAHASALPGLRLRGLMAIPAPSNDFDEQRAVADEVARLYRQLQREHATVDTLSLGMSADLEAAIAAGSTMVRIGTAIFGPRLARSPG